MTPVPSLDLQSLPDERSTSLFTPGLIYHNHMPHPAIDARLSLPTRVSIRKTGGDVPERIISLRNPNDGLLRTGITKDNRRQFLGTEIYPAAYTEFFDQELFNKHDNWKALVNEYLFSFPEPLMHGFAGIPKKSSAACTPTAASRFSSLFSTPGFINIPTIFARTEAAILEHWSAWDIVDPAEQFKEAVYVAGILFTESRDEAGEYDFFWRIC
ncbi:hypothetical protein ETB97_006306 [Aspergillus alliaceus]|uniref:Uncharacterized protein n=1 Tax=Petromyces alliaceus TaxID=209559 RepID=A0A8H5ZWK9_PETAA|nr:hypothetical protein ETB97_006306 [Aspergillus burnettii]